MNKIYYKMKLIDKDKIVREINRIENEINYEPFTDEVLGKRKICKDIKDFLDTLEVKEVNLEKEIKDYIYTLPHAKTGVQNGWRLSWHEDKVMEIAKHFYELGLKQREENKI